MVDEFNPFLLPAKILIEMWKSSSCRMNYLRRANIHKL